MTTNIIQYYDEHIYYYVVAGIKLTLYSHIAVSGTSKIRYTRTEPSVNGVNVLFHLIIFVTGEDLRIVAIDMVFDSRYHSMKEEIETLAGRGMGVREEIG